MKPFEQTGKTVEEARLRALEQLGVSEDEVEIEILDEGSKGFLGLGHSPARIRVTVKIPEGISLEQPSEIQTSDATDLAPEKPSLASEEVPEEAPAAGLRGEEIAQFLQQILDTMKMDARAVIRSRTEEQVDIEIVGRDTALLIGKHGQTISALQVLITHIVNRKSGRWVRVLLDAEGYRARHEQFLTELAHSLAQEVKRKRQEAIVFEARDARERRIVHLALANHPDVYTYSEGEGEERRVVISPKN